jgi:general secretion pathway protein A
MNFQELSSWARSWGANDIPFNKRVWIETPSLTQLKRHLEHTATFATVCLVTGTNGVGKSAAVGRWLWQLEERFFAPVAMTQSSMSGCGLLSALVQKLGQAPCFRREGNLARIEQALHQLEKRRLVVVLDESQHYSYNALEEMRLLLGLNLPSHPTFGLILVGDDYLLDTLRLQRQRALYSRIAACVRVEPWTPEQSQQWIHSAWQEVGLASSTLEDAAVEMLVKTSAGIPRSLQLLARSAWLHAAQSGKTKLSSEHVHQAMQRVPYVPGRDNHATESVIHPATS